MLQDQARSQRHFTQAARDAALARRREIAARPKDPAGTPELFIIRGAVRGNDYGWEIRRYGALLVARSSEGYGDAAAAREAGEQALRGLRRG